jgi:MFS family permease
VVEKIVSDKAADLSLLRLLRARPALRGYMTIRAADELAAQMLNVAIGWYVYSATHDPMSLAYVGLAQFLPNIGLVLIAGPAADRFDRRAIVGLALLGQTICLAAFGAWSTVAAPAAGPVYILLVVVGVARAFAAPAMAALLPRLMAAEEFPRAVAVSSSAFQICTLAGPAVGGLIYAVNGTALFAAVTALYAIAAIQTRRLSGGRATGEASVPADKSVLAGLRYIRAHRLLLALISLDLFAVLLGGVTALLPIYARDILAVGPFGLGCLRCAPGIGAAIVGMVLAHRAIARGAGKLMLAAVAGFGLAVVVFAVSHSFVLSLAALAAAGAFDMVSVVIRQTLVQIATPDAMRGRVSGVYFVFIGASNELGEFESGAAAALFGTMPAALLGGLGTLAVVALWAWIFPELRRADRLVAHAE